MERARITVTVVVSLLLLWVGFWLLRYYVADTGERQASAPQESVEEAAVGSGTYVVYEKRTVSDYGTEDRANDDVRQSEFIWYRLEDGTRQSFATVHRRSGEGGVVSYAFGTHLLVHRYGANEEDAVLSLDGSVVEQTESEWRRLRSKDGSIGVTWEDNHQKPEAWMVVERDGAEVSRIRIDREILVGTDGPSVPTPIAVSGDNRYVYVVLGPWECPEPTLLWRYDIESGEIRSVDYVQEHDLFEIRVNVDTNTLIGVESTLREKTNTMCGIAQGAPNKIHLVDLVADTGAVLRENDTFHYAQVRLSPDNAWYSYHIDDSDSVWIDAVANNDQDAYHPIAGSLLDWTGNTLVVDRDGDLTVYDMLADTLVTLDRSVGSYPEADYQVVNFIGTIVIK